MKDMTLAAKLALGFGVLVALALLLGSMAVWQMRTVGRDADQLSRENVPMVRASLEAERNMHRTRLSVRTYSLTGEETSLSNALPHLEATQASLKEAIALVEAHQRLAAMKDNVSTAEKSTEVYSALVAETARLQKATKALRARQEESDLLFIGKCDEYLADENKMFDTLIEMTTSTVNQADYPATHRDCVQCHTVSPGAASTNQAQYVETLKHRFDKVTRVNEIISAGDRVRLANWKAQALRDPALVTPALQEFNTIQKIVKDLVPATMHPNNREQLVKIGQAAEQYKTAMVAVASNLTALEELRVQRDAVADAALDAGTTNAALCLERVTQMATQSSTNLSRSAHLMVAGLVVAVLLGIFITVSLTRALTRPIRKGVEFANRMAGGNFSQRLEVDQRDEIGTLASALNTVVDNLQGQIRDLRGAANVLASSASEISASVTQVTSGAQETATAVTQTTATVEEVKQGAHLTSQKAKAVAENAQQGLQMAQAGQKAAETAAEGMARIREQMDYIAATIVKLGEQSQAIGEITATVDDIAEQSNLLAVNAAVEAAKAGEHGRGFAVVAQEIKSLAEQSKQATRQVRGILNDIQKATSAAVMATDRGSKAVDQGTQESTRAGEAILALSASFTDAAQSAGQIAASTQEQLTGMDQVAMAMESIKEASQQNVTSMKQLELAAQTLKDIGLKFTESVSRYTV